jgi:hypothetical protein
MKVTIYFTSGKVLEVKGMEPQIATDTALVLTDPDKRVRVIIPTGNGTSFVPSRNVCMVEVCPENDEEAKLFKAIQDGRE